jgi:hypothetical protein
MTVSDLPLFAKPARPDWRTDPAAAGMQYLKDNPSIYPTFRRLADLWRERNPGRRLSADAVCHVIRWETDASEDAEYKINNNVVSFLARLYLLERPEAQLTTRESHLDSLHSGVWGKLLAAARGES